MTARLFVVAAGVAALATLDVTAQTRDVGRQVLPQDDSFASVGGGVSGSLDAAREHMSVVRNRAELVAALATGPTGAPRIVYVNSVIDANVDDQTRPLTCSAY